MVGGNFLFSCFSTEFNSKTEIQEWTLDWLNTWQNNFQETNYFLIVFLNYYIVFLQPRHGSVSTPTLFPGIELKTQIFPVKVYFSCCYQYVAWLLNLYSFSICCTCSLLMNPNTPAAISAAKMINRQAKNCKRDIIKNRVPFNSNTLKTNNCKWLNVMYLKVKYNWIVLKL